MKIRRPILVAGFTASLVVAALLWFGAFTPGRRSVPASTKVQGLSASEAEILYASTCRVLDASYRQAMAKRDFKEGWFRFCDRYFARIESLEKNTNGSMPVMLSGRWPGRAGAQMTMDFPAGWPKEQ